MAWTRRKTAAAVVGGLLLAAMTVTVAIKSIQGRATSTGGKPVLMGPSAAADSVREIVGVGLQLRLAEKADAPVVMQVVPHSPAAEAGVTEGLMVGGIDDVSTRGRQLKECVDLIRGAIGTKVRLELINPDTHETNTVELTRRKIKLHP
jgi:carboxyl-terminal processing protease